MAGLFRRLINLKFLCNFLSQILVEVVEDKSIRVADLHVVKRQKNLRRGTGPAFGYWLLAFGKAVDHPPGSERQRHKGLTGLSGLTGLAGLTGRTGRNKARRRQAELMNRIVLWHTLYISYGCQTVSSDQ